MNLKTYLLLTVLGALYLTAAAQPITDHQALETAHRLETATNNGDFYSLSQFMCGDSMLANIRQKSQALKDPDHFASFRSGFMPGFSTGAFGKQVLTNIRNGNYRLLREYDSAGTKHLLFRLFGDGGLNYQDFILVRANDSIKASDVYTYSMDDWTSDELARLADIILQSSNANDDVQVIKNITDEAKKQDYAGVRASYEQLDKKYQHNRYVLKLYILACHHLDLGLYEKALIEYSTDYPEATSGYLSMLDLYYMQKQYDKALDVIDKLDKLVGGDPFLNYFRGNLYSLMDKKPESLACYEKVYRYDPSIKVNAIKLASLYAAAHQNDKAQTVITGYMKTSAYHPGDLNALYDQYPELR